MNTLKIILLALLPVALISCSLADRMASAEKKAGAAITKTDQAQQGIRAKTADYNRELSYSLTLPQTTQTVHAEDEIVSLQYDLTGAAATSQAKLDQFVNDLIKGKAAAEQEVLQDEKDNKNLKDALTTTTNQRNQYLAAANALANSNSTLADKYNKLWDGFWALVALGLVALVLRVLYAFGVFGATVAAKVP